MEKISDKLFLLMAEDSYPNWRELLTWPAFNKDALLAIDSIENLSAQQLYQIRLFITLMEELQQDVKPEQLKIVASYVFEDQIIELIHYSVKRGLTSEQIASFAKPKYSYEQMKIISDACYRGVTAEMIENQYNSSLSPQKMRELTDKLVQDIQAKKLRAIAEKQCVS